MIAFIRLGQQRLGALQCTAVPLLLPAHLPAADRRVAGWDGTLRCSPPPPSSHVSFLLLLLLFCADEIKDDFDTLGPDATLQAVGNGTGESLFPLTCDHSEDFTPRRPFKMSGLESGMFVLTGKTHSAGCFPQNMAAEKSFCLHLNISRRHFSCDCDLATTFTVDRFSQPLIRLFPAPPSPLRCSRMFCVPNPVCHFSLSHQS